MVSGHVDDAGQRVEGRALSVQKCVPIREAAHPADGMTQTALGVIRSHLSPPLLAHMTVDEHVEQWPTLAPWL